MTDDLILFHREILRWIEDGCPEHASFMDRMGLCLNAEVWLYDRMSEQPEAWKKSRESRAINEALGIKGKKKPVKVVDSPYML
jgi:hypothetical protein